MRRIADIVAAARRAYGQARSVASYLELGLGGNRVERRTDFTRCERPVLLLHGFFATRRSLSVLERRLRLDGYGVFSFHLGGLAGRFNTRRIDHLAELVSAKVERIYGRYPALGPLTVVGHSKGGLIAVYWVKRLGGHRRVRAVITLGTPHRGTPVAWVGLPFGPLVPSVLQMVPQSALIRALGGAWPPHVRVASLYSRRDGLAPYPAALIDRHGEAQVSNVEVDGTHRDFLLERRIYGEILRAIRAAEPTASHPAPAPSRAA